MSAELFSAMLIKLWIFAAQVSVEKNIATIPGAWSVISTTQEHCLMYRAPLQGNTSGQLAIFSRLAQKECLESVAIKASATIDVRPIPQASGGDARFNLKFTSEQEEKSLQIPLWGKGNDPQRFAFIGKNLGPSVTFLNPYSPCSQEDCHLCPRGHMTIVTSEGLKKICRDPRECGDKDQPACYLGSDWVGKKELCFDGSKAGWCRPDLQVTCSRATDFLACE